MITIIILLRTVAAISYSVFARILVRRVAVAAADSEIVGQSTTNYIALGMLI